MTVLLIFILIIATTLLWIFATGTTVNDKYDGVAFWMRTFFYWIAVVLSFCIGLSLNL